ELAPRGNVAEVGERDVGHADATAQLRHALMWPLQERLEQTEFVHHLEGGWVHGVATEVAQKVGMLFKHDDFETCACEQQTQHHAGRTTTDDATARLDVHTRSR